MRFVFIHSLAQGGAGLKVPCIIFTCFMTSTFTLFTISNFWLWRSYIIRAFNFVSFDLEPILVVTITNLILRVFTATLIGIYTIVELPLSFLVSFGILKLSVKNEVKNPEGLEEKDIVFAMSEIEKLLDR